jgi:hypothetical protein
VGQEEFQEILQAADRDEQEVDRWANLVQAESEKCPNIEVSVPFL